MPLHYVDPYAKRGLVYAASLRFARSRPGQLYARAIGPRIDPWLSRVTAGRYPWIVGSIATAPLVTTGAKSGLKRTRQLTYFHDGPDVILIASNYGGSKHPQWYFNLSAHPECTFGGEPFIGTEVTAPDEYERLYGLAERVYPGYGDYRASTTAVGRRIPVFRLEPAP